MPYLLLCAAALLPVLVSVILYIIDKKTPFGKLDNRLRQACYGIIFGSLAIFSTEFGIPANGAQLNCRDAAVLTAGLLFSPEAGIIAGLIGGIERYIAVYWGVGAFTQIACSISTAIAGIYSALLRKYMFENKKPGWLLSLAIGVVMEVFHLTMVFITNMGTPEKAMQVVKICAVPMIIANGVSVMLATIALAIVSKEKLIIRRDRIRISQTIQRWLLVTVLFAFLTTSYFVASLQNTLAKTQTDSLLGIAIDDISTDIRDASNKNLISVTRKAAKEIGYYDLDTIAKRHEITEISVIDKNGIIVESTNPDFVGFDMSSGYQAKEFLCLLGDTDEYVQDYGPISYDRSISRKYAGVKTDNGFIQLGYDAVQFQKDIDAEIVGITKNRHVGETGYILILDGHSDIISAPLFASKELLLEDLAAINEHEPGNTFLMSLGSEPCYCRYQMSEGYYILSVLPQNEALKVRNIALYVNTFMEILVFAILFALIYLLIKRVVVNQIKSVNQSLEKITGGNLDEIVDIRSNEEFALLSDDINSTVDTLKQYIKDASERINKELELAQQIQKSALPGIFPAFPKRKDFDIYASMDAAKEVGGDFYDFYMTDNDTLNFVVADVSGKGIPASLFMMRAKTELKSLTESGLSPHDAFTRGNKALCEGNTAGMFVTAWQGNVDLSSGVLRYANAGHNPPLVKHEGGKFEYLKPRSGFLLAGLDTSKYKPLDFNLTPGDIVYVYTDGVTEATNAENVLYGEERLLDAINSKDFENMKELCEFIKKDVDAFVGDAPQFDDITMLAFRYLGKPPVPTIHFDNAKLDDIRNVTEFIEAELEKLDCPMKTVIQINVAIDEIFSNIVKYAYSDKPGPVTVSLIKKDTPNAVCVKFVDSGIPYNPLTKEDPDITLSAEDRNIGGLGIYMVKKTMDDVRYKYENENNILTIIKNLE